MADAMADDLLPEQGLLHTYVNPNISAASTDVSGSMTDVDDGKSTPGGVLSEDGGDDKNKTPRERLPNLSAEQINWYMSLRMSRQAEVDGSSTTSTALWQDIARAFKERWGEERKWTSLAHRWDNELARFREYCREVRKAQEIGLSIIEQEHIVRPAFASFFEQHQFQDRPDAKRGAPKGGSEPAGTSRDRKVAKRRLATPIPARAYVAGAAFGLEGAGVVRGGELRAETEAKSQKERIQDNLAAGTSIVEAAAAAGADLAVLPELFPYCGLSLASMAEDARSASSEGAAALLSMRMLALAHKINLVVGGLVAVSDKDKDEDGEEEACTEESAGDKPVALRNAAFFIDRKGDVVGEYWKRNPVLAEIEVGILPGCTCVVVETDVGRIGLSIGFDLNFPSVFQEMTAKGVDLISWISVYDGGLALQAEAMKLRKPFVSAVMSHSAKVVDGSGRVLAQTSRWNRLLLNEVYIHTEVFHSDGQMDKLLELQKKYGKQLRVETLSEENLFMVVILDNALKLHEVVATCKLTPYEDYVAQNQIAIKKSLGQQPHSAKHGNRKRPRHL